MRKESGGTAPMPQANRPGELVSVLSNYLLVVAALAFAGALLLTLVRGLGFVVDELAPLREMSPPSTAEPLD